MTKEEIRAMLEPVLERMLMAGWIANFLFRQDGSLQVVWSTDDVVKVALLRQISEAMGLHRDDRAPLAFDEHAHGVRLPYAAFPELNETVASFWCERTEALNLRGDADGLLAMVHILVGWAPGPDGTIKLIEPPQ